jgi:hypothetical protein
VSGEADVEVPRDTGTLRTQLRLLKQHVGVSALDLWDDVDHNGRPDSYIRRLKEPNSGENVVVDLGRPAPLIGKIVQWIWMPSLPAHTREDWAVEISITADGTELLGPLELSGKYPEGKTYGLYQTWFRFIEKR